MGVARISVLERQLIAGVRALQSLRGDVDYIGPSCDRPVREMAVPGVGSVDRFPRMNPNVTDSFASSNCDLRRSNEGDIINNPAAIECRPIVFHENRRWDLLRLGRMYINARANLDW